MGTVLYGENKKRFRYSNHLVNTKCAAWQALIELRLRWYSKNELSQSLGKVARSPTRYATSVTWYQRVGEDKHCYIISLYIRNVEWLELEFTGTGKRLTDRANVRCGQVFPRKTQSLHMEEGFPSCETESSH